MPSEGGCTLSVTSRMGELSSSIANPKMASKSVRNMEIRGPGMLRVGAKTMPTVF
jgi:hypothetical protein